MGRRGGARARAATTVACVVAAHGLVFAVLVVEARHRDPPTVRQRTDIALALLRPDRAASARRSRSVGPIGALRPHAAASREPSAPAPVQRLPAVADPSPAPPSAASAVAAAGPATDAGATPGENARAQAALRAALACGHSGFLRLSEAERAACDRRLADARGADLPRIDTLPNAKRAYYDAVIQHREDQRYAAFKTLNDKQLARGIAAMKSHGIDVNVGYACKLKFGPGAKETNAAAGKQIGFPPCPIRLPGVDPAPP